jgi:hypothetical protein
MRRILCLIPALACLEGCITYSPQASTPVPLEDALKIVARDLNKASPVVLSDTKEGESTSLGNAIRARQCSLHQANPPLPVITGPISLQLQGQFQGQAQAGAGIGTASFQLQATRSQQQQLTVPLTFVPASALANFFLGQNVPNVSGLPAAAALDQPYKKYDNVQHIQVLIGKANAITTVATAQIKQYTDLKKDGKGQIDPSALSNYCTDAGTGQDLTLISSDISVVIPEALQAQ